MVSSFLPYFNAAATLLGLVVFFVKLDDRVKSLEIGVAGLKDDFKTLTDRCWMNHHRTAAE
jgi:hypothetical protein